MNEGKETIDPNKDCNNLFYDFRSKKLVTPLTFLMGHNSEFKVYPLPLSKLFQHPELDLNPDCSNNPFQILVGMPDEKTIPVIRMYGSYGKTIDENDIVSVLKQFSTGKLNFGEKSCKRPLVVHAFSEMLKLNFQCDLKMNAEEVVTPLLAALAIENSEDEIVNPFVQHVLEMLKFFVIKKILLKEIKNKEELKRIIKRMAGDIDHANHEQAVTLLNGLVLDLTSCLSPANLAMLDLRTTEGVLRALTNPEFLEKEKKAQIQLKLAIDRNDIFLASQLMEIVSYENPENILDYIVSKNNDELYGIVHVLFSSKLGKVAGDKITAKMFVKCQLALPKIAHAFLLELQKKSQHFVSDFESNHWEIFEKDPETWKREYKKFLKEFLSLDDTAPWGFLLRWAVREKLLKLVDSGEKLSELLCLETDDLRSFAIYCYQINKLDHALAALQAIQNRFGHFLSMQDLFLLSRIHYFIPKLSKKMSDIEKLNHYIDELVCLIGCEVRDPFFIDPLEYPGTAKVLQEIVEDDSFQLEDELAVSEQDDKLRAIIQKFHFSLHPLIAARHLKTLIFLPFLLDLINALQKPGPEDRRHKAICEFNHASFHQGNEMIPWHKRSVKTYLKIISLSEKMETEDWERLKTSIQVVGDFYTTNKDRENATSFYHDVIQVLHQRAAYSITAQTPSVIRALLDAYAPLQIRLCGEMEFSNGTELRLLCALKSFANPDFSSIYEKATAAIKRLAAASTALEKKQLAEFNFHCGYYFESKKDLLSAERFYSASLSLGENQPEYRLRLASTLFCMVQTMPDLPQLEARAYLNRALELLNYSTSVRELKLRQAWLKVYICTKKFALQDPPTPKEIKAFHKERELYDYLLKHEPNNTFQTNYIELLGYFGKETKEMDYYVQSIRANPFTKMLYLDFPQDILEQLSDNEILMILFFAYSYRNLVPHKFDIYTNQATRNLIHCLEFIKHPQKDEELRLCKTLYETYDVVYRLQKLKNLPEHQRPPKAETKSVVPDTKTMPAPEKPKPQRRVRAGGEGAVYPFEISAVRTKKPSKPQPNPEKTKRKKEFEMCKKGLDKQQRINHAAALQDQAQRREEKNHRQEALAAERARQEALAAERARQEALAEEQQRELARQEQARLQQEREAQLQRGLSWVELRLCDLGGINNLGNIQHRFYFFKNHEGNSLFESDQLGELPGMSQKVP